MARLSQIFGFIFFCLIIGWGAWATLYEHQTRGDTMGNLPIVGSPVLPPEIITALPFVGIAIVLLGVVGAFLVKSRSAGDAPIPRRRASDFDEGDPERPKINDEMIAAAAARYRAAQENKTNTDTKPNNTGPVTFGRRKSDR